MELILSAPALAGPGGVQSYLLTVAPQLERLGHEVWIYSPVLGMMAERAQELGLRVTGDEDGLPDDCDAVLAQDAPTLLVLADRYPGALRGIVVHGAELDVHLPPAVEGLVGVAIALNDVVARRVRALATPPPVVRLRQPIDTVAFAQAGAPAGEPRRALLLGNYLDGHRRAAFVAACADAGVDCNQIGLHGEFRPDPVAEIATADIVVGIGRSLLEGMSCGRPAWVYSGTVGDGWVTHERYPAIEADGVRGRATDGLGDAKEFRRALADYDPAMGDVNRALIVQHHRGYEHAVGLVEALASARPARAPAPAPLREMARLVRTQYDAQTRVDGLVRELEVLQRTNERLHEELLRLTRTLRWRTVQRAARPLDVARRALRGR